MEGICKPANLQPLSGRRKSDFHVRYESLFEFQSDGCVARVIELVGSIPDLDVNPAVYYNNIEAI